MFLPTACCLLSLAGCGGPVTVNGVVTLDGKPLSNATIVFIPDGSGRSASTLTDSEGEFTLSPRKQGGTVWPGTFRVIVSKVDAPAPPANARPGIPSPDSTYDPKITDLTLERLKHQRARSGVPNDYTQAATTPLRVGSRSSGNEKVELKLSRAE